jgi:chemotaxis family two-component system sensor kinase Cph1
VNADKNLFLFLLLLFNLNVNAQVDITEQEQIKNKQRVSYIYNFTKYIDWENLDSQTEFVIGILGKNSSELVAEFEATAQQKKIKNLPVVIKNFNTIEDITPTNILYLNKKDNYELTPILEQLYFNHCLLVTEGYPFRVSMINFIEIDDEFHFEISQEKISRAELLVDPGLLSFSIQSTADWNSLYDRLKEEKKTVENQDKELKTLTKEISAQKKEIKNQDDKLRATLDEIEVQKLLLSDQQIIISQQKSNINGQLQRLQSLAKEILKNEDVNNSLLNTFEQQYQNIANQKKELAEQYEKLENQKREIRTKEGEISSQNNRLKIQVGEIEQQRLTLYIFLAFLIFAIFFIFYMYRANKRRKESEQKLHLRNQELIALNKSLDSFTYRVSHDLKAPIINVKTMISMLEEFTDQSQNPMITEIFTNLNSSADRLENTIVDMLKLTRIERVEEAKLIVSPKEILENLSVNYTNEMQQINAELINHINDNVTVYASDIELNSVFQNLITNSIKYRHLEHPLKIEISAKTRNEICTITYRDNGVGIDLKKFEGKLFNMFERFNTDSTIEGTGVGMYIIKKLVETNNGKLDLSSDPGQGLTYHISLPIKSN